MPHADQKYIDALIKGDESIKSMHRIVKGLF